MRSMKAVAAACAGAMALAGPAACGGEEESGGGGGDGDGGGKKPVRVAVVLPALDNDFYIAQKEGIEAEAAKDPAVDLTVSAGRQRASSDEVVGLIEDASAKGVDAIAVNGSDNEPLLPVLERIIDEGTPLVLFDAASEELKGRYASYVGTDNRLGGEAAGKWLAENAPEGGELGIVLCVAGNPVTDARLEGFKAGLAGGAEFETVATVDAECDREKGRRVMEDMVAAHPDLDAVFSTSDTQTLGSIEALKAAKKDPKFVSFDAQPDAVKAIQAGEVLDASSGFSAKRIGADTVKAAVAAARGEAVEPEQIVPVSVVDKTNAADWKG